MSTKRHDGSRRHDVPLGSGIPVTAAASGADEAFDCAMRDLHAQSLSCVSPRIHARLRTARTAVAGAGPAPARGLGWAMAGGLAAVFALAIGLQFNGPLTSTTPAARTAAVDSGGRAGNDSATNDSAAYDSADSNGVLATLDENPDFYLWLASTDAVAPAAWER